MLSKSDLSIENIIPDKLDLDKNIYRSKVKSRERYNWRVVYKYSDLLISSNKNIGGRIEEPLKEIYKLLESCMKRDPSFVNSLSPVKAKPYFPRIVKKMCEKATIFNVGPMATVAGAVCEYLAENLLNYCSRLIIENGGDVYIKTNRDINAAIYLKNKYLGDEIRLIIRAKNTPCGLCSSSGSFGHSLSLGKSDLVTALARSVISADGAATAIANSISSSADIQSSIDYYKDLDNLTGILVVKDNRIGLWGDIELKS